MPYRLLDHEPPGPGLRRIAVEQIHAATIRLQKCPPDPQEAIHEVRKRLKKVRAILRLARGQLGEVLYAGENARHRDLGRLLAPLRDSHTRLEALRGLREQHPALLAHDAFQGMEELLLADRSRLAAGFSDGEIRRRALSALRGVDDGPAKWPVDGCSFDALRPGLLRVYRQGRTRMKAAYARPSPDRFHDWRKRAKYLGYQLRILEPAWPADLGTTKKTLHDLTTLLGEAHDLSELAVAVRGFEAPFSNGAQMELLSTLVAGRCADLHARARTLGERVYVEEPEAFVERIALYWSAWRHHGASSGASA
ncbi:MAG TPA: CHAD domain-containing protein [Gemmatimonadota bacterium]|nr:CHAD domain-containing protein [Gemmatimonadota bacterium]